MLVKTKIEQAKTGCGQMTSRILKKMTKSSTYSRMDDSKENGKMTKKSKVEKKAEEIYKGKENINKEVREKKSKKRGWKRVRQAALTTCRYLGMGAAHLNPATVYAHPEYSIDPKYWNRSFSSSPQHKAQQHQTPHWTHNMMFSGW